MIEFAITDITGKVGLGLKIHEKDLKNAKYLGNLVQYGLRAIEDFKKKHDV